MQVAKHKQKIFNSNKKCTTAKRNIEIIQQQGKSLKTNVRASTLKRNIENMACVRKERNRHEKNAFKNDKFKILDKIYIVGISIKM